MPFSIDQFYKRNRRALTWVIFFALLWLLRGFFGLIFLTFVIAFIAAPMVRFGQRILHLPRRGAIILVYLIFLATLVGFASSVIPQVIREANTLIGNLDEMEGRIADLKKKMTLKYPFLGQALSMALQSAIEERNGAMPPKQPPAPPAPAAIHPPESGKPDSANIADSATPVVHNLSDQEDERIIRLFLGQQGDLIREYAPAVLNALRKGIWTMLLALLFSFLITLDIARLSRDVETLRRSKLHNFYDETAQPVVRFAWVVGRAIQAQAMIACVNTLLTFIGLLIIGVQSLAVLTTIVFVCSFIPVLGVFISTTPILLVALNTGGFSMAILVIIMVTVIHLVEAYLLNPLIYGHHLKLNPVLILIILFLGHHLFGVWGMVLGVPVAYYFIHDVFGVPLWDPTRLKPKPLSPANSNLNTDSKQGNS